MPLLSLHSVSKKYGAVLAVDKLSVSIDRGEIFGLLGPSGCGKTTTLRMILGLEAPDTGVIEFKGRDITDMPPERRGFGMVFQNYALFTKLNVFENVAFGLKSKGSVEVNLAEHVARFLALVQLRGYEERCVDELSAGQQQRVAVARAIAMEPPLLLLDEPLVNLDVALRRETGWELRKLISQLNVAAVYVTHDQTEAFTLCDRIGIMSEGRVLQTGTAREIYEHPCLVSIARFLGLNLIRAMRVSAVHDTIADFKALEADHVFRVAVDSSSVNPINEPCILGVRLEDISLVSDASADGNVMLSTVRDVLFAGATTRLKLDVGGLRMEALSLRANNISPGERSLVEIPPSRFTVLPADDVKSLAKHPPD